MLNISLFHHN